MGVTQVTVAIRNPGNPEKSWEGLFLVDTGSIDCRVPGNRLREIGLVPMRGRIRRRDVSGCTVDVQRKL